VDVLTWFGGWLDQIKDRTMEAKKGVFVPLEILETWLTQMEADWHHIDSEWGPTDGGLEGALSRGEYPEIAALREYVATAKKTPNLNPTTPPAA
jgi:hypothetical protein